MAQSIWYKKLRIDEARKDKIKELMKEYDEQVYRPALKALKVECAAAGHVPGNWGINFLGNVDTQTCKHCGEVVAKIYFDKLGKEISEEEYEKERQRYIYESNAEE